MQKNMLFRNKVVLNIIKRRYWHKSDIIKVN